MPAIGRTLTGNPRLLLLDEPSEGLAPVVVERMAAAVRELKAGGLSALLSEQNLRFARAVRDSAAIIEGGRIRWRAPWIRSSTTRKRRRATSLFEGRRAGRIAIVCPGAPLRAIGYAAIPSRNDGHPRAAGGAKSGERARWMTSSWRRPG